MKTPSGGGVCVRAVCCACSCTYLCSLLSLSVIFSFKHILRTFFRDRTYRRMGVSYIRTELHLFSSHPFGPLLCYRIPRRSEIPATMRLNSR